MAPAHGEAGRCHGDGVETHADRARGERRIVSGTSASRTDRSAVRGEHGVTRWDGQRMRGEGRADRGHLSRRDPPWSRVGARGREEAQTTGVEPFPVRLGDGGEFRWDPYPCRAEPVGRLAGRDVPSLHGRCPAGRPGEGYDAPRGSHGAPVASGRFPHGSPGQHGRGRPDGVHRPSGGRSRGRLVLVPIRMRSMVLTSPYGGIPLLACAPGTGRINAAGVGRSYGSEAFGPGREPRSAHPARRRGR